MAVDFVEKKKKQKYLILIILGILVVTGLVLWFGYFREPAEISLEQEVFITKKNIKIRYETLEDPLLDILTPFQTTPPYEGELGRENPFIPPGAQQ